MEITLAVLKSREAKSEYDETREYGATSNVHIIFIKSCQNATYTQINKSVYSISIRTLLLLLLLLLLHDLYSANFEDRVRGAGVARWRT